MRRLLTALVSALLATSAIAQVTAASRLDHDAERYLRSCDGLSGDDARWCGFYRTSFVTAYRRAHAGEYQAQRNVAFLLRGGTAGVAGNFVEACAWRLVIMAQRHRELDASDTANVRFDCGRIGAPEQAEARLRALALAEQVEPPH